MELKTTKCPHCGAKITVEGSVFLHCRHCGRTVFPKQSQQPDEIPEPESTKELDKWITIRKILIGVQFVLDVLAQSSILLEHYYIFERLAALIIILQILSFIAIPLLLVFNKPLSETEKANFKKSKALLKEYLKLLYIGIWAFLFSLIIYAIDIFLKILTHE
ncbi:MAG: zinc ribbon domain-containing protein [Ruminococcus sp.]|nr:zinc ribbon domain-containing protein [Ruminococcus sp.]